MEPSSGSDVSRALNAARFLLVLLRPLVGCVLRVVSSMSDVGGESVSTLDSGALKMGDTLVVLVPAVEEGDADLCADCRVTGDMAAPT